MGGMTRRVHLPGQLLSFRWPVLTPSFWAGSVSLLPLRVLHSFFPSPVGLPEERGRGQGPCELWAAESSLLQTDPSWADSERWERLPPALSLPSYPSEVPPAPRPLLEGGRALAAAGEGLWPARLQVWAHVCTSGGVVWRGRPL